jgi:aromatic-amino-acid transaminase
MFESLPASAPDKIIELMGMFKADTRTDKIDLGVGVYKDASGKTPVMRAVKAAEERLLKAQDSKSYVGLMGDLDFVDAMREMVLGDAVAKTRVVGAQTPGGTGAVRQLYKILQSANPDATLWMSDPTWPNHPAIAKAEGLDFKTYPYLHPERLDVDFDAMMTTLEGAKAGDAILLHGCCHNPTGANLDQAQWKALTTFMTERDLLPFIDFAYQGFGDGLEEDALGVRHMAAHVPEMMIAASCSKNFGLYRDRVGAMFAVTNSDDGAGLMRGAMASINRLAYSFPPDHGAKVTQIILSDKDLTEDWKAELEEMRSGMLELRVALAEELRRATNSDRFDFVAHHRGMFSRLGLSPEQVATLREEHGIYMVGDSRVNIAGLRKEVISKLSTAIASVL